VIIKIINTSNKFCLVGIITLCFFQIKPVMASREPIINVLILKDKKIRIRSDRSIPLTIKGQKFVNKKIKGLTINKKNNKTFIFFDKNKQKFKLHKNQKIAC